MGTKRQHRAPDGPPPISSKADKLGKIRNGFGCGAHLRTNPALLGYLDGEGRLAGDHDPVAEVGTLHGEQVSVNLHPFPSLKIASQTLDAGLHQFEGQ